MNDITDEQVTDRAATDYEAARVRVQAEADSNPVRQADVRAGLIEPPVIVHWEDLPQPIADQWEAEARRKLEAGS